MTNLSVNTVKTMTPDDLEATISQLTQALKAHQDSVELLVSKVVHEQLCLVPADVQAIHILPHSEYNDEGYCFNNVMVHFDSYNDYYEGNERTLQENIDKALSSLAPLLTQDMSFNFMDLINNFGPLKAPKKQPKQFGKIRKPYSL